MSSKEEKDQSAAAESDKDKSGTEKKSEGSEDSKSSKETSAEETKSQGGEDKSGDNQGGDGDEEESKKTPSAGGRNITGPEKFVAAGGSGGSAVQTAHGYEAMAHH